MTTPAVDQIATEMCHCVKFHDPHILASLPAATP